MREDFTNTAFPCQWEDCDRCADMVLTWRDKPRIYTCEDHQEDLESAYKRVHGLPYAISSLIPFIRVRRTR